jgi:hypothetical protein
MVWLDEVEERLRRAWQLGAELAAALGRAGLSRVFERA